jgi:hypothetical protein
LLTLIAVNPEICVSRDSGNRQSDVGDLGKEVMQQLMEDETEKGRLGIRYTSLWSDEAQDFLALTMTESAQQLKKVCVISK